METDADAATDWAIAELEYGDRTYRGYLIELTSESATVQLLPEAARSLDVQPTCWLTFRSQRSSRSSIRLRACLQGREQDAGRCRLKFGLSAEDSIAVMSLIENRQVLRVSPPPDEVHPIEVAVSEGVTLTGALDGISLTGVSIRLTASDSERVPHGGEVRLRFRLPGQRNQLKMRAVVRNEAAVEGEVRAGLEFVPGNPAEYANCLRLIDGYISRHLSDRLRKLHDPSAPAA